jgi:hypothetical protein
MNVACMLDPRDGEMQGKFMILTCSPDLPHLPRVMPGCEVTR